MGLLCLVNSLAWRPPLWFFGTQRKWFPWDHITVVTFHKYDSGKYSVYIIIYIYIIFSSNHTLGSCYIPNAPWCWNIDLQNWAMVGVNVGIPSLPRFTYGCMKLTFYLIMVYLPTFTHYCISTQHHNMNLYTPSIQQSMQSYIFQ